MFSPPNLKEEILDVLAPVSIISVFMVLRSATFVFGARLIAY